ncbi:MAG: kelch repeat-containing protein, partial [Nitrospiraceae bacterium]
MGFVLLAAPLHAESTSQTRVLHGPERFVRTAGPPDVFQRTFTVAGTVSSPFTLCVLNGDPEENQFRPERCRIAELRGKDSDDADEGDDEDKGRSRRDTHKDRDEVTSGRILVDGKEVVSPRDFAKHEDYLEAGLRLSSGAHRVTVELHGPPGGHLTLAIVGTVHVGKLEKARAGHTVTLLPDGRVLFTGGRRNARELLESAELFDPQTLSSRLLAAELTTPRTEHSATLVP